jgi:hypothetical protein
MGWLDRYLEALVAHEPSRLSLARPVKFTENGRRLELGDGLWHTITGKGSRCTTKNVADFGAGIGAPLA